MRKKRYARARVCHVSILSKARLQVPDEAAEDRPPCVRQHRRGQRRPRLRAVEAQAVPGAAERVHLSEVG